MEVRFEKLTVEADVRVGRRAVPTLPNCAINAAQVCTIHNIAMNSFTAINYLRILLCCVFFWAVQIESAFAFSLLGCIMHGLHCNCLREREIQIRVDSLRHVERIVIHGSVEVRVGYGVHA